VALAQAFGKDVSDIEEIWHGLEMPYAGLFDWLEGRAKSPTWATCRCSAPSCWRIRWKRLTRQLISPR
jgi:hypothetical protein